jgi:fumarate reductase (CoM/CoB) subunit A
VKAGWYKVDISRIQTNVLIIGGGLAGLSAALELKKNGWKVTIVSKGKVGLSGNTIMTRNSIAAVLDEGTDTGTIMEHVEDTLAGGLYLNDQKLVKQLATKAREGINQLEMWGVPFIKQDGQIAVKGSPGHRRRRIVTVEACHLRSTHTAGLAISKPLLESVRESGVKLLNGILITRLLKKNGQVCGACGLDRNHSKAWSFDFSRWRGWATISLNYECRGCQWRWLCNRSSGRGKRTGYGVHPISSYGHFRAR